MPFGVSVVICTHNGALRLSPTIHHIAAQRVTPGRPWEVLVVDNGSSDNTAEVAQRCWPTPPPAPFRVISEPMLGLSHARQRGISEATHPLVAFVDDDNWLAVDWVDTAASVMEAHPEAGALGGVNEGVFEAPPPRWFKQLEELLAIGPNGVPSGDVTESLGLLSGAGLVVRRTAWVSLQDIGFRPTLPDRVGTALTMGGDTELCLALRLAGWRLWHDARLRLQHYMPSARLTWSYLRRLHNTYGTITVHYDPYYFALRRAAPDRLAHLRRRWWWQLLAAAKAIARHPRVLLRCMAGVREGDVPALRLQTMLTRLVALARLRGAYDRAVSRVLSIPWDAADSTP